MLPQEQMLLITMIKIHTIILDWEIIRVEELKVHKLVLDLIWVDVAEETRPLNSKKTLPTLKRDRWLFRD